MKVINKYPANIQPLLVLPIGITILTFIIETFVLMALLNMSHDGMGSFFGIREMDLLYGIILTVVVNIITVLALFFASFFNRLYQKQIFTCTSLLFLNIPIVIVYIFILFS